MKPCWAGLLLAAFVFAGRAEAEDKVWAAQVGDVGVQLFVPADVPVLRGLYVHAAHYKMNPKDRWAESARSIGFGHLALTIDLKSTNRPAKLARGLEDGLKELAEKAGRPELRSVPLAGVGHSAGGMVSNVLLQAPQRTLTLCLDCAWIADPAKLTRDEKAVPTLFTLGAVPDGFRMLPGIDQNFVPARRDGAPWCLGLKWGCAHDWGNAAALFIPWTEALAARIPVDAAPANGPVNLKPVSLEDGWLGDRTTTDSQWATIAPYGDFKGDKAQAVWLPNRSVSHVWRSLESRHPAVSVEAATADGAVRLPPAGAKVSRDLIVDGGTELILSVTAKDTPFAKLWFYDGDRLVAEAKKAPWQCAWKPAAGSHAIMAVWESPAGKPGVSNPALIQVRPPAR